MKKSIQQFVGEEPLYSERMKREIMQKVRVKKRKPVWMRREFAVPVLVFLLLIGGSVLFYEMLSGSTPVQQPIVVEEPSEQQQLQETFNLTMRLIDAMLTKDFAYLESVVGPDVTIDYENEMLIYDDWGYQAFIDSFDYENFEYRGFMVEGDSLFLILGVYNVSYEFQFVRDPDSEEGYLLKSLLTN
ncbi:hypothetical protein ACFO0S_14660 [Chryseomicrobium palamuruense]|uniref:DUF4367 domain-containing protein n=1 Tax=Chryseomicrobium palamuruense TaxID=682973 RepID=A0ABV8UY68_9BACL